MKKKADLTINILIVAAIGLVVLVVLLAIFTDKVKIFSSNVGGTCDEQGGKCSTSGKCDESSYPIKVLAKDCAYYNYNGTKEEGKGFGQCCLPLER
ncbi:hypothetical protein HQ529_05585 [Candidatus Woesearchaeota archaeon]|nr:hypothetical protein [Candidatus Woesearchaeota archaeon]